MNNILVVGSINMDMVIHTPRLPLLGETITGSGFATVPGGKGANQAIAAARSGGTVKMIGAVGSDLYAGTLVNHLKANGVGCEGISMVEGSTGIAVITVCGGDNHIILEKGANAALTPERIDEYAEWFRWADIVVMQLEIPFVTVLHAAKLAKRWGAKVLLNPAPACPVDGLLEYVDILIPNQYEAGEITGCEDPEESLNWFLNRGVEQAVITLGGDGCIYNEGETVCRHGVYETKVADTTAAGDGFIGGFCTALCDDSLVEEAVSYATAVSAITVSRDGASVSLPMRQEVEAFLKSIQKEQ